MERNVMQKLVSWAGARGLFDRVPDERYLRWMFWARMGTRLDLEDPQTFNEKLQWLKLYNRKPEYTVMVDKYKVRDYVAQIIGVEYLIPLLGVWDDPEEIDFDALPRQFVLKCNHNSGLGMCICKDKDALDIPKVKRELKKGLRQDYYLTGREWPYKNVPRKIICEKYMSDGNTEGLTDYKFYCFGGEVTVVMLATNRFAEGKARFDYFDREFHHLPFTWGMPNSETLPEKPEQFAQMVEIAQALAKGVPHLRVDLYLSQGRIYFGELTFFDGSGFDEIAPVEWDYRLGEWLKLEKKDNV